MCNWHEILSSYPGVGIFPQSLMDKAQVVAFKKEEVLFRQGDVPHSMLFVLSGEVRLVRYTTDGFERILQRSSHGMLAEASLDSDHYHCDIIAAAESQIMMLPRSDFKRALKTDIEFTNSWITMLSREVRRLRSQCERLSLNTAADRIIHYIECEGIDGKFELRQSKMKWAAELGLSHEALYRSLRKLVDSQMLMITGNRISLTKNTTPKLPSLTD